MTVTETRHNASNERPDAPCREQQLTTALAALLRPAVIHEVDEGTPNGEVLWGAAGGFPSLSPASPSEPDEDEEDDDDDEDDEEDVEDDEDEELDEDDEEDAEDVAED